MLKVNQIHQGDCFELLDQIEDNSIDFVFTDPPYNVSQKDSKQAYGGGRTGIEFGDWDFGFDTEKWIRQLASKPKKDSGQVVIFNAFRNMEIIARVLEEEGYRVQAEPMYWVKTNPVPNFPHRMPVSSFEYILWATRGEDYTFNRRELEKMMYGRFVASSHEEQGQRFHTTQKPMSLWQEIMKIHSNPKELALDTFGGSGVTAVSAIRLRRNYLVIEADDTYFKLSTQRVNREKRKSKTLWFK